MNTFLLKTGLALLTIIGLGVLTFQFLDLRTQQVKNEAVADCLKASGIYEYTNTTAGVKTTAPQKEYYRICITDKGYQTAWE